MAQNLKFRNPELAHSIAEKIKTVAPKKGMVKFDQNECMILVEE